MWGAQDYESDIFHHIEIDPIDEILFRLLNIPVSDGVYLKYFYDRLNGATYDTYESNLQEKKKEGRWDFYFDDMTVEEFDDRINAVKRQVKSILCRPGMWLLSDLS